MPVRPGQPSNALVATFPKAVTLSHLEVSIEAMFDGFFALALVPSGMNPDDFNFATD
jgi:hypothetical protein